MCLAETRDNPTLDAILAKWKPVQMSFSARGLSAAELTLIGNLVEAAQHLDSIFWRQSDPEGLHLYRKASDPKLQRLILINGCRRDLLNENRPFTGDQPRAPGAAFYPPGLTREQIEQYVQKYPEDRAAIYHPYTVVEWRGERLVGVPYHQVYKEFLEPIVESLRNAASLSEDAAFANFLRLRAEALLTDDYYASDLAWLELDNPKIDVIFAPYETYLDDLLGVKASYGQLRS